MPAPISKPVSYLPELKAFVENHKATPYADLLSAAAEAGWDTLLTEIEATGQPDGTVIVRFAVAIGRDNKFEPFDTLTVKVGNGPGPVSVAARRIAMDSLVYLFFNRLPELPAPQNVPVGPGADDIRLPGEDPLAPDQEYVADSAPINRRQKAAEETMPPLVHHLEPDGVPIFINFDDDIPERFTTEEIVQQFLDDLDKAAVKFDSREQLIALYSKNEAAVNFLKELGTAADKAALSKLLTDHQTRIEANAVVREVRIPGGKGSAEAAAPRRRRTA